MDVNSTRKEEAEAGQTELMMLSGNTEMKARRSLWEERRREERGCDSIGYSTLSYPVQTKVGRSFWRTNVLCFDDSSS